MFEKMEQVTKAFKFFQRIAGKDIFLTGVFGGLAGTIAMDIYNLVSWRRGKTEALYGHIAGSVLMNPIWTHRRKNFWLGQITHMITGGALGLPITYLLKRSGKNNYVLKGACSGLFSWYTVYLLAKRFNVYAINPRLAKTHYSGIIANLIYGITTAQAIVSLSPNLFQDTVVSKAESNWLSGEKEKPKGAEFSKGAENDGIDYPEKDSEPAYMH